ncbi:DUF58 domain-containing protein [Spirosoma radiotolerans]|uniref:DUF58 domain-containing protein n=1 Tax=Spirosoma radiotolerans TaxID=1379870 RepID=A0A0E3ZX91_9BACT|nr:DUF58 domain-containing protein [Spirosoma radiotolerans]AKD56268.1 hypothetical protein SD10_16540 [Spirosoma radiotolerans]
MLIAELIKLNNLQLASKLVSDELLLGIQTSRRSGIGTEFEQFRHYTPGDDPKRIDWKLFAKTGHYLVRESATESNQQVRLLIDLSGSMNYTEANVSRLQYARILLASLAYLSNRQGDQLSLYALQNGNVQTLVPSSKQAFQKIVAMLEATPASGAWENRNPAVPEFGRKQAEVLIIASDFLQVDDEWVKLIQSVAGPRREIVIFQVLGDEEINFSMNGFYRFQDLETGKEIELQADAIRDTVRERATAYLTKLEESLRIPHVRLIRVRLSDPIALVLKQFLMS